MNKLKAPVHTDGRRARSERMKFDILSTTLEMVKEGNLAPSAQQISDRTKIGIRSVFRHFEDMESLHASIDKLLKEQADLNKVEPNPEGPLKKRISMMLDHRIDLWKEYKNVILSTHAQLWKFKTLRKNYAREQREARKNLEQWIPEVKALDRTARESVNAIASFEMWHRLCEHQGMSSEQANKAINQLLNTLIKTS